MKKGREEKKMTEKEQEAQPPEEGGMIEITLQTVNMKRVRRGRRSSTPEVRYRKRDPSSNR